MGGFVESFDPLLVAFLQYMGVLDTLYNQDHRTKEWR